ncbi:hypothetical protein CL644_02590 [bacterium]|nr:hypothetical protein [Parcubacteria group bacterium]MBF05572.1 hypothetical protein [bacterium]|tara:strand:- start:7090 stop:7791 length:702 start_codon:yes stop_codon:yes gene_type:complete
MEYRFNYNSDTITEMLFQPKMLLSLAVAWLALVIIGSALTVSAANTSTFNETEGEASISETEQLARSANVAYNNETRSEQALANNTVTVFPERLVIPRIGIDLPVSNPQSRNIQVLDEELTKGAVRYPDSAKLGEKGGNVLLFGHSSRLPVVRNKFFKAFNGIETLNVGDVIQAYSGSDVYSYRVNRVYRASATDDRIALGVEGERLTLLTCDSFGKRSDRWVVEAEFFEKSS